MKITSIQAFLFRGNSRPTVCPTVTAAALLLALVSAGRLHGADHTYDFGGGNTLRIVDSNDPSTGNRSHRTVQTWANGNVYDSASSHNANGDYKSSSDNTYNFGNGNTLRTANSYDSPTGTSSYGTVQTWGNGSVYSSGSSHSAAGDYKTGTDNTYNFGNGNTLRSVNTYDSATGTRSYGTTQTWGDGSSSRSK